MSKYNSRKAVVDGIRFDSQKEASRYRELRLLERTGAIQDLQRQQVFTLIPSQKRGGKVVERSVTYKADFAYVKDGQYIVEDVKGFKTPEYILKRKLMLYVHGIRVRET